MSTRKKVDPAIGDRLKAVREKHGVGLRELGRQLPGGESKWRSELSRVENHIQLPSLPLLAALSARFNMSIHELTLGRSFQGAEQIIVYGDSDARAATLIHSAVMKGSTLANANGWFAEHAALGGISKMSDQEVLDAILAHGRSTKATPKRGIVPEPEAPKPRRFS